ncbi:hypothetical protein OC842_003671 [Tilletia horrida]|uniref:Secreted protein n=1 Tax=Tilletia horrida TaxID=155126 RepID=A0AAN6GD70_9BASI|nr:hypothetical protein OC842_003671 [Tilletia horrida]KAK0559645.1 hypothetical protein OC844_004274 [Tilletia horrida]
MRPRFQVDMMLAPAKSLALVAVLAAQLGAVASLSIGSGTDLRGDRNTACTPFVPFLAQLQCYSGKCETIYGIDGLPNSYCAGVQNGAKCRTVKDCYYSAKDVSCKPHTDSSGNTANRCILNDPRACFTDADCQDPAYNLPGAKCNDQFKFCVDVCNNKDIPCAPRSTITSTKTKAASSTTKRATSTSTKTK